MSSDNKVADSVMEKRNGQEELRGTATIPTNLDSNCLYLSFRVEDGAEAADHILYG